MCTYGGATGNASQAMRTKPSHLQGPEPDEFGLSPSRIDIELDYENANSADEVIGEMGLLLVGILGFVVVVHLMLTALHVN